MTNQVEHKQSIRFTETAQGAEFIYSLGSRIETGLVLFMLVGLLSLWSAVILINTPSVLDPNGWTLGLVPLFAFAALRMLVRTGVFRSPVVLTVDGTVRQGGIGWKFPALPSAESVREGSRGASYFIVLRGGSTQIRVPGGDTENATATAAMHFNQWRLQRTGGSRDYLAQSRGSSAQSWPVYLAVVLGLATLAGNIVFDSSYSDLRSTAPIAHWAAVMATSVVCVGILTTALRLKYFSNEGALAGTLTVEAVSGLLLTLAISISAVYLGQCVQFWVTPVTHRTVELPLDLVHSSNRKGCQTDLTIRDTASALNTKVCVDRSLESFQNAQTVQVNIAENGYGVAVESVSPTLRPDVASPLSSKN